MKTQKGNVFLGLYKYYNNLDTVFSNFEGLTRKYSNGYSFKIWTTLCPCSSIIGQ